MAKKKAAPGGDANIRDIRHESVKRKNIPPAQIAAEGTVPLLGKVGSKLNLEQGVESARLVGINILSTVRNTLDSLDRVKRLVKTLGMVNATPEFLDHINALGIPAGITPRVPSSL